MALPLDVIPITIYVDRKYVEQVDVWAEKLCTSRSKVCRAMIEDSAYEMGWVYDIATSRLGLKIRELVKALQEVEARKEAAGVVPAA